MANKFGGDSDCKGWWQFEPDALMTDTMGLNDFTTLEGDVAVNELYRKEGTGSAEFDGSWDSLRIDDAALAAGFPLKNGDLTKTISVCFWVRFKSVETSALSTARQALFAKGYAATCSFAVALWKDLAAPQEWCLATGYNGGIDWERHDSGVSPVADRWYHVGATYDDATRAYVLRIWDDTDGAIVVNMSGTGTNPINVDAGRVHVGAYFVSGDFADAYLDELVVFSRVLTATDDGEIDQIRQGIYVAEAPWRGTCQFGFNLSGKMDVTTLAPWYAIGTYPIRETLRFETEIIQSHNRTEQRIAKRYGIPRQIVDLECVLRTDAETAAFDAMVHSWGKKLWPVPLWWDAEPHVGDLLAGAGSISIDTTNADYRANGFALIFQRGPTETVTAEKVRIASVADDALTLSGTTVNDYIGTKWVMPLRQGYLQSAEKGRHQGGTTLVRMEFAVTDNVALTGYSAPMTYDTMEVLTVPPYVRSGTQDEDYDPDVATLDAGTGTFEQVSNSEFNEVSQSHVWVLQTRAECWELRRFLHSIRGRQAPVLVPTWHYDLTLSRDYAAGTAIYVVNRGYADHMGLNDMRTYLAFRPTGAEIIVRKVTGITRLSATEEQIDLDLAPGQAFSAGDHLCWVDKCRLKDDDVTFHWRHRHKLTCAVEWVRVT